MGLVVSAGYRRVVDFAERRRRAELLRDRLYLLDGVDRVLMKLVVERGSSCRELAKLLGVSESTVCRRVRRLSDRLLDGPYILCLRHSSRFSTEQLAVARDYFLRGLSVRRVAAKYGWSYHRARLVVQRLKQMVRELSGGDRVGRVDGSETEPAGGIGYGQD